MIRCRLVAPATNTSPAQMVMKIIEVPRSGCIKTKNKGGIDRSNEKSSVFRLFRSPPLSLIKRARIRIRLIFANSDGCN